LPNQIESQSSAAGLFDVVLGVEEKGDISENLDYAEFVLEN